MRLLHTRKLRFQEFFDVDIPKYAILSHRWGPDEVSYQDFLAGAKKGGVGYRKILEACAYAANEVRMFLGSDDQGNDTGMAENYGRAETKWVWVEFGFDWIWIDTCCIDKSSSAEGSESINSIHQWYGRSEVCYAYLSDVTGDFMIEFEEFQWFTRGWTIQELLAPRDVMFLSKQWQALGSKNNLACISNITGTPSPYLYGVDGGKLAGISTVEMFGWAAGRKTSRKEDQAYCLLGLFDISMPLLYGEGDKAFRRLQRKILKSSKDESIFLWDHPSYSYLYHGLLAKSIASFGNRPGRQYDLEREFLKIPGLTRPPYLVTNQGLQFQMPQTLARKPEVLVPLNCQCIYQDGSRGACAIRLKKMTNEGTWARIFFGGLVEISTTPQRCCSPPARVLWFVYRPRGLGLEPRRACQ